MGWYSTYNTTMNALQSGLATVRLDAYNYRKFHKVVFGPWEDLEELPCLHILETDPDKNVMSFDQTAMVQTLPVELHTFIEEPWKQRRYPLTAREAVLQTISNVWDYFVSLPGRTLNYTCQAAVPQRIAPWDFDRDYGVYHFIVHIKIDLAITPV